jgi:hypothetical protein
MSNEWSQAAGLKESGLEEPELKEPGSAFLGRSYNSQVSSQQEKNL